MLFRHKLETCPVLVAGRRFPMVARSKEWAFFWENCGDGVRGRRGAGVAALRARSEDRGKGREDSGSTSVCVVDVVPPAN